MKKCKSISEGNKYLNSSKRKALLLSSVITSTEVEGKNKELRKYMEKLNQ